MTRKSCTLCFVLAVCLITASILGTLKMASAATPTPRPSLSHSDLSGEWSAEGYGCEQPVLREIIRIQVSGGSIEARKVRGDNCIGPGEITWMGTLMDAPQIPVQVQTTDLPTRKSRRFVSATLVLVSADQLRIPEMSLVFRRWRQANLSGRWNGEGYQCNRQTPQSIDHEVVDIKQDQDRIEATKVLGDNCIERGDVTWRGTMTADAFPVSVNALVGSTKQFVDGTVHVVSPDLVELMTPNTIEGRVIFTRGETVRVYIWDRDLSNGSPFGHVFVQGFQEGQFLSPFPVNRLNWSRLTPEPTFSQSVVHEGHPPSVGYIVSVPDAAAFSTALLRLADRGEYPKWSMTPDKNDETNCADAAYRALTAGGLSLGTGSRFITPADLKERLEALKATGSVVQLPDSSIRK